MPKEEMQALVSEFLHTNFSSSIRSDIAIELEKRKNEGKLLLFSSSPDFLVIPIGLRFNVLHSIGTEYVFDDQGLLKTIGKVVDGNQKLIYLKNYLTNFGVGLQDVVAYSDSMDDFELLTNVGEPIAVYPDRKLEKIAIKNSWKIVKKRSL